MNQDSIKKYIMFIGTVRTGHNLIASLLNCQSKISISIEINPILRFKRKFSRDKCFNRILSYCEKSTKFRRGGYNYKIENTFQNNINDVEIIGDSMTNTKNTRLLYDDNEFYKKFSKYVNVPISKIWVIRNPFDVIQSYCKMKGNKFTINDSIKLHLEIVSKTIEIYKRDKENTIIVYLEEFINNVEEELKRIFDFINYSSYDNDCIKSCSEFVFKKPHKTFNKEDWKEDEINTVKNFINSNKELEYYKKFF